MPKVFWYFNKKQRRWTWKYYWHGEKIITQLVTYWIMNTYEYYKSVVIDLSKQSELENPDLKQQINFIGKLEDDKARFFLSLRNQKK